MKTEFEVRVINIDPDKIKKQLSKIDAVRQGDFFMRRCVYDIPGKSGQAWVRLRDDGRQVTLAYKERHSQAEHLNFSELYIWHVTCPRCAQIYGQTQTVIFAKIV